MDENTLLVSIRGKIHIDDFSIRNNIYIVKFTKTMISILIFLFTLQILLLFIIICKRRITIDQMRIFLDTFFSAWNRMIHLDSL